MANQSWTFDAPTGVYKNHQLSAEIRLASIQQTKFVQFSSIEPGYGKKKGESVTITRLSNIAIPGDDTLVELERIPEDTFSLSTQQITAVERGRAIPYTNLSVEFSYFDLEQAVQKKLRDQLAVRLDIVAATAFKNGQIKMTPNGIASISTSTSGSANATATANLNVYHIEQIRDELYSTLYVQPYIDGDYVGIVSTKAKRGIIRDPNWEKWHVYSDNEGKFQGEIGRLEGIRFVESNNANAISGSLGASSVLGEAFFFGDDPVVMANVLDPELRAKESEDYGRAKGIAWYGVYQIDQVWKDSANAGEARVVHVTSS